MPVTKFPDPRETDDDGILAWGGDLEPETLLLAYSQGIFPWPIDKRLPLAWFCPPKRAVLDFRRIHIPRSLARTRRRASFRLTLDLDFAGVIRACARQPRPGQRGTWITPAMVEAYIELHRQGHAHSAEAWEDTPEGPVLVGGIYGVDAGGAFAGESMFHHRSDASKLALLRLVEHLEARGLDWMDIQVLTPHLEALGAHEVSRDDFLRRLERTRSWNLSLFPSL